MKSKLCSFKDIFDGKTVKKIVIPIIQRDYAQGRKSPEVARIREKFLNSLFNAITDKPITLDFVYGNNEKGCLTPLDGQQRLTTLFLLHWYAAKKEGVSESDYEFLRNFSYETRYSAREFCKKLVDYTPQFNGTLSEEIKDQTLSEKIKDQWWFSRDWENDPTISSMLVMLDAIDKKFKGVSGIWNELTKNDGCIKFYFLPIENMGLTDDLYIRMNSRGKPLTSFEHFKAEFEKKMRDVVKDDSRANDVMIKIDGKWTDLLWAYSTDNHIIDDRFLNYFRFVCDIISLKKGGKRVEVEDDALVWLESFDAFDEMEKYFDCWCDIPNYENPDDFLQSFMSASGKHEKGKIKVDSDIFKRCLNSDNFSYGDTVLLYAVTVYLRNTNDIEEPDFKRRIRIVNNLIKNSDDEIRETNMKAILEQTEEIILEGTIPDTPGFNTYQRDEERAKEEFLKKNLQNNPGIDEIMFELEDHKLLYGQISIVADIAKTDIQNFETLAQNFASLFECSYDKIDCALMAKGDYGQRVKYGCYQYACKYDEAWKTLFHKRKLNAEDNAPGKSCSYFQNTHKILIKLLSDESAVTGFTDEILKDVSDKFLKDCVEKKSYPPEYYYIKYDVYRPYNYHGMMYDSVGNKYLFAVMTTKERISVNTYLPCLKAAEEDGIKQCNDSNTFESKYQYLDCNGKFKVYVAFEYTVNPDGAEEYVANAFEYTVKYPDGAEESISIPNKNSIDTVDRVELLKQKIQSLLAK